MALDRWQRVAEGENPQTELDLPGFPPAQELTAEIRRLTDRPRRLTASRSFLAGASDQSGQASCATPDTS